MRYPPSWLTQDMNVLRHITNACGHAIFTGNDLNIFLPIFICPRLTLLVLHPVSEM